jgi:sugar fermentation stimulation protein A
MALDGFPLARARPRPLRARFVARPNRFVAEVRLRGGTARAHLPNSGRLTGTLAGGAPVLLDGPHAARACPWTLLAVREAEVWVGTVTTLPSRLFPELWRRGLFPELPGRALAAEVVHGRSRFDFTIDGEPVELKSVTAVSGGVARFPDAVTARGARHCEELGAIAGAGGAAAVVFFAQRADARAVTPDDATDPAFGVALRAAAARGVRVLACALRLEPEGVTAAWRIPVEL